LIGLHLSKLENNWVCIDETQEKLVPVKQHKEKREHCLIFNTYNFKKLLYEILSLRCCVLIIKEPKLGISPYFLKLILIISQFLFDKYASNEQKAQKKRSNKEARGPCTHAS